jgi:sarcosine oxidase subunit gamma
MFETRSALAAYAGSRGEPAAVSGPQLRIAEIRGWHLAHLTAWRATRGEFTGCLAAAFGTGLPEPLYRGITHGTTRIVRLTRDQYWWVGTAAAGLAQLRSAVPAAYGALTDLTDARVRLGVSGSAARELLAAGVALDLHPAAFVIGQSAQTGLHHTGIFLERVAADAYELFIPRTFAATIWEFLVDAALPHGVKPE